MWDTKKGELWGIGHGSQLIPENLKISGDRSKIFHLNNDSIQAYSIQTGELVGRVKVEEGLVQDTLIVDGSRVWVYSPKLGYEGWDFGIPGSLPVQLHNISPHQLHPSGSVLWDASLSRIKDQATGRVVFQLSGRFPRPVDAQWNGQYLVVYYPLNEVLILDFSYFFLQ